MILTTTLWLVTAFAAEPVAKLSDVAWLAGPWRGDLYGGKIEEVWTPGIGGVMMGMFRMVNAKGQASIYEFQVLEETPEGVNLRIKHFNRALKGQELPEKFVDFKLVRSTAQEAVFAAVEEDARVTLVYSQKSAGHLDVDFHKVIVSTGKEQKIRFPFEKAQ